MRVANLLAGLAAALVLAGCGGGDEAPDSTVAEGATPAASSTPSPTASAPGINPSATLKPKPPTAPGPLRVVYTNASGLWSATLAGGAPKRLDTHTEFDGLAVSPDGKTVAFMPKDAGLFLVDVDGGKPRLLDKDGLGDPVFSPDGKTIAMVHNDGEGLNVFSTNVDGTGSRKLSSASEYFVRYFPNGDLLVGGPHSLDRLPAAGGSATRIFATDDQYQFVHALDLSPDGRRIVYAFEAEGSLDIKTDVYVMEADGKKSRRLTKTEDVNVPAWSPDGTTIVFTRFSKSGVEGKNLGVWAINADGTKLRGLAKSGSDPRFTPDGRYVVYLQGQGLRVVRPDGSGAKTVGKGEVGYYAFVPAND